jgi:hypothetical protein
VWRGPFVFSELGKNNPGTLGDSTQSGAARSVGISEIAATQYGFDTISHPQNQDETHHHHIKN